MAIGATGGEVPYALRNRSGSNGSLTTGLTGSDGVKRDKNQAAQGAKKVRNVAVIAQPPVSSPPPAVTSSPSRIGTCVRMSVVPVVVGVAATAFMYSAQITQLLAQHNIISRNCGWFGC